MLSLTLRSINTEGKLLFFLQLLKAGAHKHIKNASSFKIKAGGGGGGGGGGVQKDGAEEAVEPQL